MIELDRVAEFAERFEVDLDWKAYFREFCAKHGEPILFKGRLLFPDGWRYSAYDYAGPEYPPPNASNTQGRKELLRLQLSYHKYKLAVNRKELRERLLQLQNLTDLQAAKDVPLQQKYSYVDQEGGGVVTKSSSIDLSKLHGRIGWLKESIAEEEQEVGSLQAEFDRLNDYHRTVVGYTKELMDR